MATPEDRRGRRAVLAEQAARTAVLAELAASAPSKVRRGNPSTAVPEHLLIVGIVVDHRGEHAAVMAMHGLTSLTYSPGVTRRFTVAGARDLIARLQIATDHAEAHPGTAAETGGPDAVAMGTRRNELETGTGGHRRDSTDSDHVGGGPRPRSELGATGGDPERGRGGRHVDRA